MFELADESYAVQNANEELKKYVTAILIHGMIEFGYDAGSHLNIYFDVWFYYCKSEN